MPTPTDLVTDLPADFEVFGQAVDSSMADLKGGTTGQILSKATNTDMDFVWTSANPGDITGVTATSPLTGGGTSGDVTVGIQASSTTQSGAVQLEDSTSSTSTTKAATPNSVKSAYDLANAAIAKSTLTTAGDTLYRNATVPARLGIGTAGQVLTVNSGATAPEWATPSGGSTNVSGKNAVLNSAMNVWQRGTSFSSPATPSYTADRWSYLNSGAGAFTISRQATADSTNLPFIQYALRYQRNSGQTATNVVYLTQSMESINSIPYAGKTITFSFYARAGANYSAASNILSVNVSSGTGTDQNINTSFTGIATVIGQNATLTTTWQRFSYTGTVSSAATQLGFYVNWTPVGTASTNDYFEITGVQLEAAASATAYSPNTSTYALELAACQRYYYSHASGTALSIGNAGYYSATQVNGMVQFPVSMRTTPSLVATSGTDYYIADRNGASDTFNSLTIYRATPTTAMLYNNSEATGTAGHAALLYTNNASSSVAFSAEL